MADAIPQVVWTAAPGDGGIEYINQWAALPYRVGIAALPDHGTAAKEVLEVADAALYCGKRAGRDQAAVAQLPTPSQPDTILEIRRSWTTAAVKQFMEPWTRSSPDYLWSDEASSPPSW